MINSILGDRRIEVLQRALGGLAQRQQAIAGNVANVDTPGYKRREVPFEAELQASLGSGHGSRLVTTSMGHVPRSPARATLLSTATGSRGNSRTGRNEGTDVDIDYEMTQMAETSLRYQLLTEATGSRFTTLKDIVTRAS